ncbi:MAG: dTDP-4-dehydrorhamnose 3,5-epimerase [Chlamydiae bacterium]|nr:dTDP-4-dehydrorhamnose 3,5-epimerase [Chlamydiota bacterium]
MQITEMQLEGALKLSPKVFYDERGFFYESFKESLLQEMGICETFCQDNHSYSKRGVLRGMHFQGSQGKLINVISGVIFDVFVDVRKDSPTFGKWQGVVLDSANRELLYIPGGFAHGFYVMSDEAHVVYKVTELYSPSTEKSFRYDDADVGITWPEGTKIVSTKDLSALCFSEVSL